MPHDLSNFWLFLGLLLVIACQLTLVWFILRGPLVRSPRRPKTQPKPYTDLTPLIPRLKADR